ncbi:Uncharacterised protein [uncultured archaeon]|nr:Uncharacterised protein [uncultured archaeon]
MGNACRTDLCYNVSCPDKCEGNVSYSYGSCDPQIGACTYFGVTNCTCGCADEECLTAELDEPGDAEQAQAGGGLPCIGGLMLALAGLAFAAKGGR